MEDVVERPHTRSLVIRRLRGPLVAAAVAITVASAGYVVVEGWRWDDALYMSMITMGQVGYGEVHPLTDAGRYWTMAVILAGFAVFVYSAASLTALFVSGDVAAALRERRRSKVREQLQDHVVIVGFGRVGRASADAALRCGHAVVVIDSAEALETAVDLVGAVFLKGDARDVTVLRTAGVTRAAALITSLDDPSNAVVALTARSIAPGLRIVARVTDSNWSDRLMRAGASHVVPVYESVGASMAATALDAEVLGVLAVPGSDMRVEEVEVGDGSRAEGTDLRSLMDLAPDVHILGLRHGDQVRRWHEADGSLAAGDMLVALGTAVSLARLTALVRHGSADATV
ncbi:MAG: potassium channel family protein [Ilumatobacteraceae bacterium]